MLYSFICCWWYKKFSFGIGHSVTHLKIQINSWKSVLWMLAPRRTTGWFKSCVTQISFIKIVLLFPASKLCGHIIMSNYQIIIILWVAKMPTFIICLDCFHDICWKYLRYFNVFISTLFLYFIGHQILQCVGTVVLHFYFQCTAWKIIVSPR
jgi:hypothetical protein